MITIKYRGSYAKQPQQTGTRGCEPSDRDLMALDEEVWRSNLGRGSEIERLRVKGARAAALAAPAACSRGGAAPEKTELGLPGADSNGGWVGRHLRDMHNPPEATERRIGAWSDLGKARGGAGPWGSPASGCAGRSGARACVQQCRGACARHVQAWVEVVRGSARRQGVRLGGAAARVAGERRTST